jgi:hypothetical protein
MPCRPAPRRCLSHRLRGVVTATFCAGKRLATRVQRTKSTASHRLRDRRRRRHVGHARLGRRPGRYPPTPPDTAARSASDRRAPPGAALSATARPDNPARASLRMAGTGLNLRRRWHRCHHAAAQLARRLTHMTRYANQSVGLYVVMNGAGEDVGGAAPRRHRTDHSSSGATCAIRSRTAVTESGSRWESRIWRNASSPMSRCWRANQYRSMLTSGAPMSARIDSAARL